MPGGPVSARSGLASERQRHRVGLALQGCLELHADFALELPASAHVLRLTVSCLLSPPSSENTSVLQCGSVTEPSLDTHR